MKVFSSIYEYLNLNLLELPDYLVFFLNGKHMQIMKHHLLVNKIPWMNDLQMVLYHYVYEIIWYGAPSISVYQLIMNSINYCSYCLSLTLLYEDFLLIWKNVQIIDDEHERFWVL